MKILNLYACIGGNRYKWDEVEDIEVTAVELDPYCAELYQERFPNDKVIIADAHQYLLDHYQEFDFIWSSPPCPTHSKLVQSNKNKIKMKYPDMKLYEEILFLKHIYKGKFVVENVIPYYTPLIPAQKRHRHLYWTNFKLPNILSDRKGVQLSTGTNELKKFCKFHDFDFYKYKGKQPKTKIARNLVDYEAGKTILETVLEIYKCNNSKQMLLFQDSVSLEL